MPKLALVTPIHKPHLSELEVCRLRVTLKLNSEFDHYFVIPKNMNAIDLIRNFPESKLMVFDDYYFSSKHTYNDLMLSLEFYYNFLNFEYILIHQTDAFLIKNISSLLDQSFTYLGASWNPGFIVQNIFGRIYINRKILTFLPGIRLDSGNGGLSLRKTSIIFEVIKSFKFNKLLTSQVFENRMIAEDILLVYMLHIYGISVISRNIADLYFIESTIIDLLSAEKKFGFHALEKFQPNLEKNLLEKYT